MSYNLNYFGSIPFNPDNLPERKLITGPGTNRPIGLSYNQLFKLYWTVRSFNINIGILPIGQDIFSQFLLAGGATATIAGSTAGLNAVQQSLAANSGYTLKGKTKIQTKYTKKVRIQPDGVVNGVPQSSIAIDYSVRPNILNSYNLYVNESSLCSAGPVHILTNAYGSVVIDMSDIIYAKNFYWPVIKVLISNGGGTSASSIVTPDSVTRVINGLYFEDIGIIQMYGSTDPNALIPLLQVGGRISIGTACCDRFYYDSYNRLSTEDACSQQCQQVTMKSSNDGLVSA